MKSPNEYINNVTEWALSSSAIIALALVGSHARNTARADSDIDFLLICKQKSRLIKDLFWANRFGEVLKCDTEQWGKVTSIRVTYKEGQEIEFGIATLNWTNIPIDPGTFRVVSDGMVILKRP